MNTTLTQELQGLKYSKESHKPEEQYEQDAWIRSQLPEKYQKQAQEELDFARVQAVERAPTGRDSSKLFPLTLSLYL